MGSIKVPDCENPAKNLCASCLLKHVGERCVPPDVKTTKSWPEMCVVKCSNYEEE